MSEVFDTSLILRLQEALCSPWQIKTLCCLAWEALGILLNRSGSIAVLTFSGGNNQVRGLRIGDWLVLRIKATRNDGGRVFAVVSIVQIHFDTNFAWWQNAQLYGESKAYEKAQFLEFPRDTITLALRPLAFMLTRCGTLHRVDTALLCGAVGHIPLDSTLIDTLIKPTWTNSARVANAIYPSLPGTFLPSPLGWGMIIRLCLLCAGTFLLSQRGWKCTCGQVYESKHSRGSHIGWATRRGEKHLHIQVERLAVSA